MRFEITLLTDRPLSLPIDMREYLTAAIYGFIERVDPDYARFVHDEGFGAAPGDPGRRYKLFTYAPLRAPSSRRTIDAARDRITFAPGEISYLLASPVEEFIRTVAGGLLALGSLRIAATQIAVSQIQILPTPRFAEEMRFTCLSPIVAARSQPKSEGGGTRFLRPLDEPDEFGAIVRQGLIDRYAVLHGSAPADDRFEIMFDAEYLATHRGGTKLTHYKDTKIVGAFAPFTARGSTELMELAWHAGLGSKTGLGHGMVDVVG